MDSIVKVAKARKDSFAEIVRANIKAVVEHVMWSLQVPRFFSQLEYTATPVSILYTRSLDRIEPDEVSKYIKMARGLTFKGKRLVDIEKYILVETPVASSVLRLHDIIAHLEKCTIMYIDVAG